MKVIREVEAIAQLPQGQIRQHIESELEKLLAEFPQDYSPSVHGWFVVLDIVDDLYAPLDVLPYSLFSKLQDHSFEWLGKAKAHYEVLLIVDDNESVMVYVPALLLHHLPCLEAELISIANPVA